MVSFGNVRFNNNFGSTGRISPIGGSSKERKPFKTSTKKRVWMKAGGHNPDNWRTGFIKTTRCMNPHCKKVLKWDEHLYEFDHRDNNHANISEKNCYVVCLECHKKHTKIKKILIRGAIPLLDTHKTIKLKVGYKKQKIKKQHKKTRRTRRQRGFMDFTFPKNPF